MALRGRARLPARAADDRVLDRGHPGGRQGVLREAGPAVDGAMSEPRLVALLCRTSDRGPEGAAGARGAGEALARAARGRRRGSSARRASRATALGGGPARLARVHPRGRRPDRRRARRRRFPILLASDCTICLTTLPAVAAPPPRRVRAVARRARRLQHARDDAVAASSAACAWPARAALWETGFESAGPALDPTRVVMCGVRDIDARRARAARDARRRPRRAARRCWPARSRGARSSCTSTSTCSTRR